MPKAFDRVRIARKVSRPTSLDYITHIFEDFIEFHGDRNFADDKAIVGGIASLNGVPVTVIGIQKVRQWKRISKETSVLLIQRATERLSVL